MLLRAKILLMFIVNFLIDTTIYVIIVLRY